MIWSRGVPLLLAPLVVTLAVMGCSRGEDATHAEVPPAVEAEIHVAKVREVFPGHESVFSGRIKATQEVTVTSRLAGVVTSLPFQEGDPFDPGQILVTFEEEEVVAAIAAARASLASAQVHLAQAERQYTRVDSLYATRVASRREQELIEAQLENARAEFSRANAEAERLTNGARLQAPFGGVVVDYRVDEGTRVSVGQPLLDIRSRGAGEVVAAVGESEIDRLSSARAWVQVGDGPWYEAEIDRIEGMTDYKTRTRKVYLRPSSEELPLLPGSFAKVRFVGGPNSLDTKTALFVPYRALVFRGALTGVFVVNQGRASLRWIRIGPTNSDEVEVLSGLRAGELVVLDPEGLVDGQQVRVSS